MRNWSQNDLHKHMHVYSSDNKEIGHVDETYEDSFLVHRGIFFSKNRYIPYSAVATVDKDRVQLKLSADQAGERKWEKRPDYEDHLGDPLQLFYDEGHGVQNPFEETKTDKT